MSKTNILYVAILMILVAGGSFWAGMKYQQRQRFSFNRHAGGDFNNLNFNGANGAMNSRGARMGGRPVAGEIISLDDQSLTVKTADGSSKVVIMGEKSQINQATPAEKSDLKVGQQIAVFGQENSDGSLTAQTIQITPVLPTGESNTR